MNCPKCSSGVLEQLGYIKIKFNVNGYLDFEHSMDKKTEFAPLFICSLDECSHVVTSALPRTLHEGKKFYREKMYREGLLLVR
ncbi:hypothetical protein NSQ59_27590 [Margalitia sp. FSL K6-0131]|uniref:hypothetical protein n=1 Tax=Margalitia sp. FSL K6-0131 TaxID=2954604 RepID=UPI0030FA2470